MSIDYKNASKDKLKKEFKRLAKEIGDDRFFTKKELNYLPEILQDGEVIITFTSGVMNGNTWIITLTDRRIIFLDKGMIFGLKQEFVPLNKVNAVSCTTGLIFGNIIITDGAKDRVITYVLKGTVKFFTNKVQIALDAINNKSKSTKPIADDPYERLEKIANLKNKGIITEEEFQKEKDKILGN